MRTEIIRFLKNIFQRSLDKSANNTPQRLDGLSSNNVNLSRDKVLQMIEGNGGAKGLDLSGRNLSCIDLKKVDLRG